MSLSAPTYGAYWPTLAQAWDAAKIQPARMNEALAVAHRLFAAKDRYVAVEKQTNVLWWIIACIGEREAGAAIFSRQLGQGDRLDRVSVNEPAGMGPYLGVGAWERAAVDALKLDHLSAVIDWRLEKAIYYWIKYNGWGYYQFHNKMLSPYAFGATMVQMLGKYGPHDGQWSPNEMDQQLGTVAMLKALMTIDPTIEIVRET